MASMNASKTVFDWATIASDPAKHRGGVRLQDFTHVRLYHFCRPVDIQSYLKNGIRLFQHQELAQQFHERFKDVAQEHRDYAVARMLHDRSEPRVDAMMDERCMSAQKNFYSSHGSEMIRGFCAELYGPTGIDYRTRLLESGTPAVIVFEAPLDEVEYEAIEDVNMALEGLSAGRYEEFVGPGHITCFALSFMKTVPPEWITDHRWIDVASLSRELADDS